MEQCITDTLVEEKRLLQHHIKKMEKEDQILQKEFIRVLNDINSLMKDNYNLVN